MLDDFSLEQNIAYKIMINSVKNSKLSHAYIIETNGYSRAKDFTLAFCKYLLCPKNYSSKVDCGECHQCESIDENEFIELEIIEADGQWIKKSQLEELQQNFSKKSILGTKKVYIINGADKLNTSSSNALLKFLEEPEEGIIAILIVENTSTLLRTIVSRCQVLSLKNTKSLDNYSCTEKVAHILRNNNEDISEYVANAKNYQNIGKVVEFAKFYEENGFQTIIYINSLWHDYFKEKLEIYDAFNILMLFYKDCLNYKLGNEVKIFNDHSNSVVEVSDKNSVDMLISKIHVIMDLKEKIKFNVNSNALMDKLIIELRGCETND